MLVTYAGELTQIVECTVTFGHELTKLFEFPLHGMLQVQKIILTLNYLKLVVPTSDLPSVKPKERDILNLQADLVLSLINMKKIYI